VVTFMNAMGANQGDLIIMQTVDRDAGCREQAALTPATAQADCVGGAGPWYWDETNQTHPNFQDNLSMAQAYHDGIGGLPIVWWQTPFGAPSASPGGSAGHLRDNKVDYFLKRSAELVAVGALGIVFCAGAENQTTPSTDDGQYQTLSKQYLAKPAPLPRWSATPGHFRESLLLAARAGPSGLPADGTRGNHQTLAVASGSAPLFAEE
jgi:hypothetical protein